MKKRCNQIRRMLYSRWIWCEQIFSVYLNQKKPLSDQRPAFHLHNQMWGTATYRQHEPFINTGIYTINCCICCCLFSLLSYLLMRPLFLPTVKRKTSCMSFCSACCETANWRLTNLVRRIADVACTRLKTPQCPFIFNLYFQAQSPDTQTYTRFAIVFLCIFYK